MTFALNSATSSSFMNTYKPSTQSEDAIVEKPQETNELESIKNVKDKDLEQGFNDSNKDSDQLKSLGDKLKKGQSLTLEEEELLKSKDPDLFSRSESTAKQAKEYTNALEQTSSEEEAEEVKANVISSFSQELKSVYENPYISDDKKVKLAASINEELEDILNTHNDFMVKSKYLNAETPTVQDFVDKQDSTEEKLSTTAFSVSAKLSTTKFSFTPQPKSLNELINSFSPAKKSNFNIKA